MPEIGVNKVILIGRTGADAEIKYTSSGKAVANFSLAINDSFKNRDGEQTERVEWVRCVAWEKLAEVCGEFLTKGKQAYAEGRLQTRTYEDREGNQRTVSEVVVRQLRLLGGPGNGNGNGNGNAEQSTRPAENPDAEIRDEDIPF
jgi:single-strand DNA-binding protein